MELSLKGSDSRRGVARNKPVMVRFGSAEHARIHAAAQAVALDFATYVRCAANTFADHADVTLTVEPAADPRQLALSVERDIEPEPAPVPKARKARSAEAPARKPKRKAASAASYNPSRGTPTPSKRNGKRGRK